MDERLTGWLRDGRAALALAALLAVAAAVRLVSVERHARWPRNGSEPAAQPAAAGREELPLAVSIDIPLSGGVEQVPLNPFTSVHIREHLERLAEEAAARLAEEEAARLAEEEAVRAAEAEAARLAAEAAAAQGPIEAAAPEPEPARTVEFGYRGMMVRPDGVALALVEHVTAGTMGFFRAGESAWGLVVEAVAREAVRLRLPDGSIREVAAGGTMTIVEEP